METQLNTILVPIDSSHQTLVALNQSYALAQLTNSRIVLLGVDESKINILPLLLALAMEARLKSGATVDIIVRTGNVANEICSIADLLQPLFIVMGVTSNKLKNGITAKHASKIIRESKYPVIAVKAKRYNKNCKTIVLPLDLEVETREKVSKGVEVAKFFNAQIHIVSVLAAPDEISENKLNAYSQQALHYIKSKGVNAILKTIVSNDIAASVLNYSSSISADLIVVMSKYELSLIEYFIGTTADRLINESDIPVLSIHPKIKKDMSVFLPY